MINETISLSEFEARVSADPNYPLVVHLNMLRIMVTLPTMQDTTDRALADITLFIKGGQATVLHNNLGPPTLSLETQRLNIYALLHRDCSIFPYPYPSAKTEKRRWEMLKYLENAPDPIKRLLIAYWDPSGAHDANPDNEFNNESWINRK